MTDRIDHAAEAQDLLHRWDDEEASGAQVLERAIEIKKGDADE